MAKSQADGSGDDRLSARGGSPKRASSSKRASILARRDELKREGEAEREGELEALESERFPSSASSPASDILGRRGLALLLVSLVAMISSSLFFHETGNRLLTYGSVFGLVVNARALSCLVNIAGIVVGFGLSAHFAAWFAPLRRDRRFWAAFFVMQELLVAVFYLTFSPQGPCLGTFVVQFVSGVSVAVFLTSCIGFARYCTFAQFRMLLAIAIMLVAAVTYGLMSAVAVNTSLVTSLCAQAAIMAMSALCYLGFIWPSNLGPWKAIALPDPVPDLPCAISADRRPLSYFLFILASYGLVFGFLHVIPLGLPTFQLPRVIPNLVGAFVAMGLFVVTVPKSEPTTVLIWNRIYRISFPFVVLAALLIPYTSSNEFVSSLSFVESAQFFFIALLITGCFVVCRTTGVGYSHVFSLAMLIYNIGFLVGNVIAAIVHEVMPLTDRYFGLIGIAVFLLLTVVTFNTNADKYAKTAWGILPRETPKALYSKKMARRCEELAREHGLTARESETLLLLAQGKRPKEISEIRTVSIATVRTHVQGVYSKLGVHSADELARLVRGKE